LVVAVFVDLDVVLRRLLVRGRRRGDDDVVVRGGLFDRRGPLVRA